MRKVSSPHFLEAFIFRKKLSYGCMKTFSRKYDLSWPCTKPILREQLVACQGRIKFIGYGTIVYPAGSKDMSQWASPNINTARHNKLPSGQRACAEWNFVFGIFRFWHVNLHLTILNCWFTSWRPKCGVKHYEIAKTVWQAMRTWK